jgi:ubiquinone/menaquinone biosynthesis C-methylase UbiE
LDRTVAEINQSDAPASPPGANFTLKDEIRAYWSERAKTFDLSWGHKIRTEEELAGWAALFAMPGGVKRGDKVLELASGTGEVTRVLVSMGCTVEAIDLSEPMIERARTKHRQAPVRFHLGDAENTMMPDAAFDAVVCRHLVWTLVDPAAALADWFRVLKPGGRLIIADGDWVSTTRRAKLLRWLSARLDGFGGARPLWDQSAHEKIIARVYFRDGLRTDALARMVRAAGFEAVAISPLDAVRGPQWRSASWSERLRLLATDDSDTFLITAAKPAPIPETKTR